MKLDSGHVKSVVFFIIKILPFYLNLKKKKGFKEELSSRFSNNYKYEKKKDLLSKFEN